jgi:hypothetical protein
LGAHDVVAAVADFVQLDVFGQQLPVAVPSWNADLIRSSAATMRVSGADSFVTGQLSRSSAK